MQPYIAASILTANFACLGAEVTAVLAAGAESIHFDVMDNHYVPNLTIGPMVCQALRDYGIIAAIDVHLMVQPVDSLISAFAKAGATSITIHPETTNDLTGSLQLIHSLGCAAGLALNPTTDLNCLVDCALTLDSILLMGVAPGFGGQPLLPNTIARIAKVRQLLNQQAPKGSVRPKLAVDGGVNLTNGRDLLQAGAEILVIGSAIFQDPRGCYQTVIQQMRSWFQRV